MLGLEALGVSYAVNHAWLPFVLTLGPFLALRCELPLVPGLWSLSWSYITDQGRLLVMPVLGQHDEIYMQVEIVATSAVFRAT